MPPSSLRSSASSGARGDNSVLCRLRLLGEPAGDSPSGETSPRRPCDLNRKAKAFTRTYGFLAAILPFTNAESEKPSIFLNFLTPKLPAPEEQDLSKGILEAIDMGSYRVEAQATMSIALPDADAEIGPVPLGGGGRKPEPELDFLSNILKTFNEVFGNIDGKDVDKIGKVIAEELPAKVAADKAYQNAVQNSDKQNARTEHDKALERAVMRCG